MQLSNPKALSVIVLLAAGIIISIAATKPSGSDHSLTNTANSDTGFFKNLQVLPKNISKDSLDKIMDNFKAALGVRCNFCHAFNNGKMDFASDEKQEKGIARYMMKMTTEINTKYFNFEKSERPDTINVIKCQTCHHGNPHPDEASMNNDNEHHDMPPGPPPPGPPQGDSSKHDNQ